jgi:hypothetical protein
MTPLEIKIANSDIYFVSNALSASFETKILRYLFWRILAGNFFSNSIIT